MVWLLRSERVLGWRGRSRLEVVGRMRPRWRLNRRRIRQRLLLLRWRVLWWWVLLEHGLIMILTLE